MTKSPETRLNALVERYSLDSAAKSTLLRLAEWSLTVEISGTAIDTLDSAVERHIADSLVGLDIPELRAAESVVDIGSGLGFPGLALAVALPDCRFVLVDSVLKKMEAAARIAAELSIDNVECVWGRAEEIAEQGSPHRESFDVVAARALADLAVLLEYASPLLKTDGTLVAWKGTPDPQELAAAAAATGPTAMSEPLEVPVEPFRGSRRALFVAKKFGPTPTRLPRRAGMALKKPLA